MENIKSLLLSTDFLGPPIGFEYMGRKNFQSIQGSIYSLIIISITVVICFMFGQEIYLRKNPSTYLSQDIIPESVVKLHDFPIFFAFIDGNARNIQNLTKILSWDVVELIVSANATINRTVYELDLKPCNFSSFEEKFQPLLQATYVHSAINFYCFDDSRYFFKNPYGTIDSAYLNFRFRECDNTTTQCLPGLDGLISNLFVDMIYFDSYIDSTNYTTPVQYIDNSITTQLSGNFLKRYMMRVINNILNADNGWLLDDVQVIPYLGLYNYISEFSTIDPAFPLDRFWITFESPRLRNNTFRSYLKIQDLLAKIGGISKFLLILIQIISNQHLYILYLGFIKKFANEEIEYQLNHNKKKELTLNKEKEVKLPKISLGDLNNSNSLFINIDENQNSVVEVKKVEAIMKVKKQEKADENKPIGQISPNEAISQLQPKLNNFLMHSKTVTEFYTHHEDHFSYYDYIKAYICFDSKKIDKYDKSLSTIQKLIDIKLFSRLMVNFHHKSG